MWKLVSLCATKNIFSCQRHKRDCSQSGAQFVPTMPHKKKNCNDTSIKVGLLLLVRVLYKILYPHDLHLIGSWGLMELFVPQAEWK